MIGREASLNTDLDYLSVADSIGTVFIRSTANDNVVLSLITRCVFLVFHFSKLSHMRSITRKQGSIRDIDSFKYIYFRK